MSKKKIKSIDPSSHSFLKMNLAISSNNQSFYPHDIFNLTNDPKYNDNYRGTYVTQTNSGTCVYKIRYDVIDEVREGNPCNINLDIITESHTIIPIPEKHTPDHHCPTYPPYMIDIIKNNFDSLPQEYPIWVNSLRYKPKKSATP